MSDQRSNLGLGLLAFVPVACCIGIPLIAAAGISVAVAAWAGGIALGAIVLLAAVIVLAIRVRRRRGRRGPLRGLSRERVSADCCSPDPIERMSEARSAAGGGPLVEILYFDGCPNHEPAIALVERISRELGIEPNVQLVNVPDQQAARRLRFLGSPTIRVGGIDVDPATEQRDDYALSCRVFRTKAGFSGQPDERWVRDALLREAGVSA